jgi:hypothetical protein
MKKIKKQAKLAKARTKHAASATATGAKFAVLAGRPSKQAVTAVFGSSGYALSNAFPPSFHLNKWEG